MLKVFFFNKSKANSFHSRLTGTNELVRQEKYGGLDEIKML